MTVIADLGEVWIELHNVGPVAVNAAGFANVDFNLDRPGRFAGGNCSMGQLSNEREVTNRLLSTTTSQLIFGTAITAARVRFENAGAINETAAQGYAIIFLKK